MKKAVIGTIIMCLFLSFASAAQAKSNNQFDDTIEIEYIDENTDDSESMPMMELVPAKYIESESDLDEEVKEDQDDTFFEILSPQDDFVTSELDLSLSISAQKGDFIKVFIYDSEQEDAIITKDQLEIKDIGICLEEINFEDSGKYMIEVELFDDLELLASDFVNITIVGKEEARAYMEQTIQKLDLKNTIRNAVELNKNVEQLVKPLIEIETNLDSKEEPLEKSVKKTSQKQKKIQEVETKAKKINSKN